MFVGKMYFSDFKSSVSYVLNQYSVAAGPPSVKNILIAYCLQKALTFIESDLTPISKT